MLLAAHALDAMRCLFLDLSTVGLTAANSGAGTVIGARATPRVLAKLPFGWVLVLGPAVSVEALATWVATVVWPSHWLASTAFILFDVGPNLWTISSTTQRQTMTPQAMLGRVWADFLTVTLALGPLDAALDGSVGARWGAPAYLRLAPGGYGVQAVLNFWSRVGVCGDCHKKFQLDG